jgi:SPP1 gp7 family putative phage head morphogenesis protein
VPQPRRGTSRGTTVSRSSNGAPEAQLTEQQAAEIRAKIGAKEQAPSSRVQAVFQNWREVADQLGDPFERERIALSKLRQMRRDPMLGFALSFIKVPHLRAKWFMNASSNSGPSAQIAAHADENWRRIHASFVQAYMNSLDFGFQAIAKRFEFRIPAGTYIETGETGEGTEQPIWSEGGVEPIAFKPFVPLRPEGVEPIWNNLGEFDGIEYSPTGGDNTGQAQTGQGSGASQGGGAGGTNKEEVFKIDLAHSLWVTNERESNFGSIFGYPRLGYAYSYWWSYWFRWAIADRAFERKGDPSVIVYHPEGEFINEDTGERMSHSEYALLMGERIRSGGVIALPSETFEGVNGPTNVRMWEIDFTKDHATNFEPFDKSFEYLDVQKLRAMFVPEQAFLEGKGGTSSRNVASTLGSAFIAAQDVLSREIANHINRYVLPQWLAANYPEFVLDGGKVEIVIQGFGDDDTEFTLQLLQLIGQQESGSRELAKLADIQKILEDRGTPIVSFAEQQRREQQIIAEQQAAAGPAGPVTPGGGGLATAPGVGILPSPTGTGFSYYVPKDIIQLADTGTDFIIGLPSTKHFEDNAVLGFARLIWTIWRDLYREEYESAAIALTPDIALSDDDLQFAISDRVKKILDRWQGSSNWDAVILKTRDLMKSLFKRSAQVELLRLRQNQQQTVPDEAVEGWLNNHLPQMVAKAAETTRSEVEMFLERKLEEGHSLEEMPAMIREHFADFPAWKADRLVRTEVRDIYNAATIYAAEARGYSHVQALDGIGDPECAARNGQIYPTREAMLERDHPNGSLAWRAVSPAFSIERNTEEGFEGAEYDEENEVLTLSASIDDQTQRKILLDIFDSVQT